jgi:hypothetical protein
MEDLKARYSLTAEDAAMVCRWAERASTMPDGLPSLGDVLLARRIAAFLKDHAPELAPPHA